jgi:hypothetical protein
MKSRKENKCIELVVTVKERVVKELRLRAQVITVGGTTTAPNIDKRYNTYIDLFFCKVV